MFRRLAEVAQNRYVGVAVIGSLAGILLLLLFLIIRGQRDTVVLQVQPIQDASIISVYVGGDVAAPGLYSLPRGSRIFDAINAAGGLLASADTSAIGLASPLQDADQVIIPSQPAATSTRAPDFPSQVSPQTDVTVPPISSPQAATSTATASGPVNVNTATVQELEGLPEIGPAIAQRIVDYRTQHGPFQTLEELAAVSGISDRMVEDLRALITLGY